MGNADKSMTLTQLKKEMLSLFDSKGYCTAYRYRVSSVFYQLTKFCDGDGEVFFTKELGQAFMQKKYGVPPGTVAIAHRFVHRILDMMHDYQTFGSLVLRKKIYREFPPCFSEPSEAYLDKLKAEWKSDATIVRSKLILWRFTGYLVEHGVYSFDDITPSLVTNFLKLLSCNYCGRTVQEYTSITRRYLSFLFNGGHITNNMASIMPSIHLSSTPVRLPSVWKTDELERLLASVDRGNPVGKRDYAILILATKLGLRTGDILNLECANLNWADHEINIVQRKTGEPLLLPLPQDVGWALIDYLKNGRPKSDEPKIFLRAVPPYFPLAVLDHILYKYLRLAKIDNPRVMQKGMRTLRHSLATHMLEQEVPIHVIQNVLGHTSVNTTKLYTSVNVNQLRACALEVPIQ